VLIDFPASFRSQRARLGLAQVEAAELVACSARRRNAPALQRGIEGSHFTNSNIFIISSRDPWWSGGETPNMSFTHSISLPSMSNGPKSYRMPAG
jgi:hypothetical protein